jgi:site-specific DNA-methyltransferase (adenine-specific)
MGELNNKNCYIMNQIFNIDKKYKLNLYHGDTLEIKIKDVFNKGKFDVIIGNPPYNKEVERHNISLPLYNEFIEKYIDKCTYMTFIVPSRWFSGGKGLDKFRKLMLERKDIPYIKHFDDASKIFGNLVDIKGGVNYYLKDTNYDGKCNFNGSETQLNKYDIFVDSKYYKIIDKLIKYDDITKIYNSQDHYKIQSNDKRLVSKNEDNHIVCYVSQQKGFKMYIDKKYIDIKCDNYKVITTSAAHQANSGFGNIFVGKPNEVHCKSYISFDVNNKLEAEYLREYMKCRLPNFMLSLRKRSHNLSGDTCSWIPLPPLDRTWTDKKLYEYYELTDNDIKIIKETEIIGIDK